MSAFNPVIDSTKIQTRTFQSVAGRLDADTASVFASLNTAGFDVASIDVFKADSPTGRADLFTVVIVAKSR